MYRPFVTKQGKTCTNVALLFTLCSFGKGPNRRLSISYFPLPQEKKLDCVLTVIQFVYLTYSSLRLRNAASVAVWAVVFALSSSPVSLASAPEPCSPPGQRRGGGKAQGRCVEAPQAPFWFSRIKAQEFRVQWALNGIRNLGFVQKVQSTVGIKWNP